MRIYSVVTHDRAFRYYYYGSKKEAVEDAWRFRQQYREDDEIDNWSVEIETIHVEPTRAGIARALQDVIDMTCTNEF